MSTVQGHGGDPVKQIDPPDGSRRDSGLVDEGTQHVALADLVAAPGEDQQGAVGRPE